ncbi:MAG TPA: hypothetical protein VKB21_01725, partial [Candidatus Acidoferrum sp.]|nr:hypothetical protein [Candidatus Acidoferrum sp.]
ILTSRALGSLLFGVSRLDRITYFSVIALVVFVSALACWAPARRATKVDPNVALRYEWGPHTRFLPARFLEVHSEPK